MLLIGGPGLHDRSGAGDGNNMYSIWSIRSKLRELEWKKQGEQGGESSAGHYERSEEEQTFLSPGSGGSNFFISLAQLHRIVLDLLLLEDSKHAKL